MGNTKGYIPQYQELLEVHGLPSTPGAHCPSGHRWWSSHLPWFHWDAILSSGDCIYIGLGCLFPLAFVGKWGVRVLEWAPQQMML